MATMLEAMISGKSLGEPKLGRGIKHVESLLRKAGFKVWERPRSMTNARGQMVQSIATPSAGSLSVNRFAGYDFEVEAGIGFNPNDRVRQQARDLITQARNALETMGYQIVQRAEATPLSFVVQGKRPA